MTLGSMLQSATQLPAEILIGTPLPKGTTMTFASRPLVALRYAHPKPAAPRSILPHEYTHVLQALHRHVDLQEGSSSTRVERSSDELEAYHVGYCAVNAAMRIDAAALSPYDAHALFIDSARRLHADPDKPFELNAPLANYLQRSDISLA